MDGETQIKLWKVYLEKFMNNDCNIIDIRGGKKREHGLISGQF